MPYLSIVCVISYVIGHALGPSMYPRAGPGFRCPSPVRSALETSGLSSLERLQGAPDSASLPLSWGRGVFFGGGEHGESEGRLFRLEHAAWCGWALQEVVAPF